MISSGELRDLRRRRKQAWDEYTNEGKAGKLVILIADLDIILDKILGPKNDDI